MNLLAIIIYATITGLAFYLLLKQRNRRSNRLPPGPAPWPVIGNLPHLGTIPHHTLAALAKKYGPLMHLRLGFVDVVVASSASVAAQFLKTHDANFGSRPPNSGAKHVAYDNHDMVFAPYGPRWRMLRKICSINLFSVKAVNNFQHVRQEEVTMLTSSLVAAGKSTVKLRLLVNVCVTNALARALLGRRVVGDGSGGGDPKADEFMDMVLELMKVAGEFNIGDFIPALDWLDVQGVTRKMKKLHIKFDSFLNTILEEQKNGSGGMSSRIDLLSTLISPEDDADGDGKKLSLSDIEIKALLLNLFAAGTDSTYVTVEWAMAELIHHPEILQQAKEEIDTVVGKDRLVTELDISRLTFLQAIVKETFRLHPASPLSVPRIAAESCEIDGFHVPKGATLLVNLWAIARDPHMWNDPHEFRPDRFLIGGEKCDVDIKGNDFEVIPFGAGRRICAGMILGLNMVQLLTATLVHAFDWELPNNLDAEKLNMEEAFGQTVKMAEPLMVHARPRLSPDVNKSG